MTRTRITLLITAIVVFTAGATVLGVRHATAAPIKEDYSVLEAVDGPVVVKPPTPPDSGEPDTGTTKWQGQNQRYSLQLGKGDSRRPDILWPRAVHSITRIWMARFFGTGF